MKRGIAAAVLAGALAAFGAHAEDGLIVGEIRGVDADARKVIIRHGPLRNAGMPAMTMTYRVWDPAMLEDLNAAMWSGSGPRSSAASLSSPGWSRRDSRRSEG